MRQRRKRRGFQPARCVDDKDEPAAAVIVGPVVEPFGREHRVLRRLHDRRPAGPVGKLDDALDAQQVGAALAGKPAERAGEVEAARRPAEDGGKGGDAVGMRGAGYLPA